MNFPVEIPTPKKIPKDYAREFRFYGKSGFLIISRGPNGGIGVNQSGDLDGLESSRCLDWIGEVISRIRHEVGW